jgi:lipoate-protein ligase B
MPAARRELWVTRLGPIDYDEALDLQQQIHRARVAGQIPDTLLLLEHPPVYTRGRRSADDELTMSPGFYAERGIAIHDVDRGGKVTYHGPGQLVGYPIVSTQLTGGDVTRLVAKLEQSMIDALAEQGIAAKRDPAGRGVWAGEGDQAAKIGSIGLHISQGVTTHGVMVNVDNDLTPFEWIRPCGLDEPVTSVGALTGKQDELDCFARRLAFATAQNFDLRQRIVSRARLTAAINDLALTP